MVIGTGHRYHYHHHCHRFHHLHHQLSNMIITCFFIFIIWFIFISKRYCAFVSFFRLKHSATYLESSSATPVTKSNEQDLHLVLGIYHVQTAELLPFSTFTRQAAAWLKSDHWQWPCATTPPSQTRASRRSLLGRNFSLKRLYAESCQSTSADLFWRRPTKYGLHFRSWKMSFSTRTIFS